MKIFLSHRICETVSIVIGLVITHRAEITVVFAIVQMLQSTWRVNLNFDFWTEFDDGILNVVLDLIDLASKHLIELSFKVVHELCWVFSV
jgi:hypothetical protein